MATGPINYMASLPQPDFARDIQSGLLLGGALRERQDARIAQEKAQIAAQQYNTDVTAAISNPTPQAFSALALKYPQQREAIKQAWEGLDEGERKSQGEAMAQSYSALLSGKPEVAKEVIQGRIEARKNSGMDTASEENILKILDADPRQAQAALGFILSHTTDPAKFAENFGKIGTEQRAQEEAPAELRRKLAQAGEAESVQAIKAAEAKTAPQKFALELESKGWDIKKLQEDVRASKEGTRLRAMEVALSRENNDIKRQELQQKIDEAAGKQTEKLREKVANAETELASVTDAQGLIGEILDDKDTLLAATGLGAFRGAIPGTKARTMAGKLEQLQNQLAATNLDKLKGPMSDKDILFVKRIAANLDRYQDEDLFVKELGKVQDILTRTEEKVRSKYGMPKSRPAPSPQPGADQREIVVDF